MYILLEWYDMSHANNSYCYNLKYILFNYTSALLQEKVGVYVEIKIPIVPIANKYGYDIISVLILMKVALNTIYHHQPS